MRAAVFDKRGMTTAQIERLITERAVAPEQIAADIFAGHQWIDFPIGSGGTQRQTNTTYTNTTGALIRLWVRTTSIASASSITVTIDQGLPTEQSFSSGSIGTLLSGAHTLGAVDVLPGQTYRASGRAIAQWKELRKG